MTALLSAVALTGCQSESDDTSTATATATATEGSPSPPVEGAVILGETDGLGAAIPEPLDRVADGARVVTIGEATHGTHEFFAIKADLIRHLVTTGRIDTVLIEDSVPAAAAASRYVAVGEGDAASASGDILDIFDTAELVELLEWLREYNESAESPVGFYGMDVPQYGVGPSLDLLREVLSPVDAAVASQVAEAASCLPSDEAAVLAYSDLASTEQDVCLTAVTGARDAVAELMPELSQADPTSADLAWLTGAALVAGEPYYRTVQDSTTDGAGRAITTRDLGMADIVAATVEGPMAAVPAVWLHNVHAGTFTGLRDGDIEISATTAAVLADRFGADDVATVGFSFESGTFHAFGATGLLDVFEAAPPQEGSVGAVLSGSDLPFMVATADVADFGDALPFRTLIGAGYDDSAPPDGDYTDVVVADVFDVLVHVPTMSPSQVLNEDILAGEATDTFGTLTVFDSELPVLAACPDGDRLVVEVPPGTLRLPAASTTTGTLALISGDVTTESDGIMVETDGTSYRAEGQLVTPDSPEPATFDLTVPDLTAACPS